MKLFRLFLQQKRLVKVGAEYTSPKQREGSGGALAFEAVPTCGGGQLSKGKHSYSEADYMVPPTPGEMAKPPP